MEDYRLKYDELKSEFGRYQCLTEEKIQNLSEKNVRLEKNLDILYNIVEISNYVNSFLSSDNLIPMINDMIIGVLGVNHSTIFLLEDNKLIVKVTNISGGKVGLTDECRKNMLEHKTFIINSRSPIMQCGGVNIHSRMGVPIKIRDKFIGYIIIDHTHYNFLTEDHKLFIKSIANQTAIAIENSILYKRIQKAAKSDPLLDIYNRRTFYDLVEQKIAAVPNRRYAIVMIDLDNFKKINDTLGHQFGDEVLIQTSNLIKSSLNDEDMVARYGGEEIIIYIDNVNSIESVFDKIDAMRKSIENNTISRDGISKNATASFGLAYCPEDGTDLVSIIKVADKLLYKAKAAGKNKVVISNLKT